MVRLGSSDGITAIASRRQLPVLDGQTGDSRHLLRFRGDQRRIVGDRVGGDRGVEVFNPLAPLLEDCLDVANASDTASVHSTRVSSPRRRSD
jgi:hypothetical protein